MQQHALGYLARMDGYESVDELIRSKVDDYAAQGLTYEQAAEELVADTWSGIFSTEADFKRWVEFQCGQATAKTPQSSRPRTRRKSWMCGIEYAGADEIRNAFESGDMDQLERLADRAADALVTKSTYSSVDRLPRHRLNWHGSRV